MLDSVTPAVPNYEISTLVKCREKLTLFTELANIFNDSDNQKLWRELLNRVGWIKVDCKTFGIIDCVVLMLFVLHLEGHVAKFTFANWPDSE